MKSISENIRAKSYDTHNWRDDFNPIEIESIDIVKPDPLVSENAAAVVGKVAGPLVDATKVALGSIADVSNTMRRKEKEEQKELDDQRTKSKNIKTWSRDDEEKIDEGAYRGGGTIIDPSGLRNKWGIPPLKPGSGPTKEVPLTPSQNRLLVKKKTKTTKAVG